MDPERELPNFGPRSPLLETPPRQPGSVRRTATIDTIRPKEPDTRRTVVARARDLATGPEGEPIDLDDVGLVARVDDVTFELLEVTTDPPDDRLAALGPVGVMGGFRRRLSEVLDDPDDTGTLALLLLDDLSGAELVAGYGAMYQRPPAERVMDPTSALHITARADTCAGWVSDGTLLTIFRQTSAVPILIGPVAPPVRVADDPEAWHDAGPLAPGAMRRRRRLDLAPAIGAHHHPFEAHFRDSHVSDTGEETVVHEYRLHGVVDGASRTLVDIAAEALVLPYAECPNALASARQVIGMPVAELRRQVHRQLSGTGSCTHLNDMLRSLGDLDVLLDRLPAA